MRRVGELARALRALEQVDAALTEALREDERRRRKRLAELADQLVPVKSTEPA